MDILVICNLCWGVTDPKCIMYCKTWGRTFQNISKLVKTFRNMPTVVVNDKHQKDDKEFSYLPPHFYSPTDIMPFYPCQSCANVQFLNKTTLSAAKNNHLMQFLKAKKPDTVWLAGFVASFDILSTAFDLIDQKFSIGTVTDCINDLDEKHLEMALQQMKWMGIQERKLDQAPNLAD